MQFQQRSFREVIPSILLVMTVVAFTSLSRAVLSPLLFLVEEDFQLTHGPSSRLFLYISMGFGFSLIISGFVSSRITHRGTILLACLVLSAALLFTSLSTGLAMMGICMFFVGAGAGLYPSSGLSVLHGLVVRQDIQKAISLHEFGPHLGMLTAPLIANIFITLGSWRGAYLALGIMTLSVGLLFLARTSRDSRGGEAPSMARIIALCKDPAFLVLILFFSLALGSMQGIYSLVPTFLINEAGMLPQRANLLFGASRVTPLVSLAIAGPLQDRFGPRASLRFSLACGGLIVFFMGILKGPMLSAVVFLQPAVGALILPAGIGAVSTIGPPESRNVTFSMLLPIAAVIGTGVIPSWIGYMGDHASFSLAFALLGIGTAASSVLAGVIKN